jgi:predicted PurR-regulated permease PerM
MSRERLQIIALWLGISVAAVFLLERLFVVLGFLASPLLLFAIAWLIALVLQPAVALVSGPELAIAHGDEPGGAVAPGRRQVPRALAVLIVYVALLTVLLVTILALVPAIGPQLEGLGTSMPTSDTVVQWTTSVQRTLGQLGFQGDITSIVQPEAIAQQAATLGSTAIQQSLGIAGSIATLLFNVTLVLILSFYITLDGPRLGERMLALMPVNMREETQTFFAIVDRTFGGFLRAQLLNSVLYGFATTVVMSIVGLNDVALASVISAFLVLIPLIGGFFALVPPALIALIEAPDRLLPVLVGLLIVQQVLFNVVQPRLVGQIIGLHPLLVFAALLVGGAVAGGWGILFGIPVAGVISSVLHYVYLRSQRPQMARRLQGLPERPPEREPERPQVDPAVELKTPPRP